jgi:hypothetical protein
VPCNRRSKTPGAKATDHVAIVKSANAPLAILPQHDRLGCFLEPIVDQTVKFFATFFLELKDVS